MAKNQHPSTPELALLRPVDPALAGSARRAAETAWTIDALAFAVDQMRSVTVDTEAADAPYREAAIGRLVELMGRLAGDVAGACDGLAEALQGSHEAH